MRIAHAAFYPLLALVACDNRAFSPWDEALDAGHSLALGDGQIAQDEGPRVSEEPLFCEGAASITGSVEGGGRWSFLTHSMVSP